MRADPAAGCKALFEWVGVDAGDDVLETIRVLSREQFSELGAVPRASGRSTASSIAAASRELLFKARGVRERFASSNGNGAVDPGDAVAFYFARAMHDCDGETLRSLTAPKFELVYRSADGDLVRRGDDARAALVNIAEDTFSRRYMGEWWASAAGGVGDWWTSAPGHPLRTMFFSGLGGNSTRVDVAIALAIADDLVSRAVIVSAGPLGGRSVVSSSEDAAVLT
jgi:hypothetical protein